MFDDMEVHVQDLAIDEIRELLLEAGADITEQQAEQLASFIAKAGGLEAALDAIAQLQALKLPAPREAA